MKILSTLLMQLVLTQTDSTKPLGLFDEPGLTWKQTPHGLQASRAEIGSNRGAVKHITHATLSDNFKRIDLNNEKRSEKQKKKERKHARKNDRKKFVKPEKSKFIIARPSVNRETMPPQPHPHQWLNAFFRTGNGDDSSTTDKTKSELHGRLAERRQLLRSARRESSKQKEFKSCDGLARPELECKDCAPGYPYYDCTHRSKSKGTFKCKVECSKGRSLVSTVHKIKCRQSGWKQLYPQVIQCVPREDS